MDEVRTPALSPRDISLVFQGPAGHKGSSLSANISRARALFPEAEILLSTWAGTKDAAFDLCDRVVFSEDPGPLYHAVVTRRPNNVVRQARSTFAGLAAATRPLAAKIRTDFAITGDGFTGLWQRFVPADPPACRFRRPVVTLTYGSTDPTGLPKLFHPSDFFHFGLREDLMEYWDFQVPPRYARDRFMSAREKLCSPVSGPEWGRLAPEQEIFLSFLLRGHGRDIFLRRMDELSPELMAESERLILNSFCLAAPEAAEVAVPERLARLDTLNTGMYAPGEQTVLARQSPEQAAARYRRARRARAGHWLGWGPVYSIVSVILKLSGIGNSDWVHRKFIAFKRWRYRAHGIKV